MASRFKRALRQRRARCERSAIALAHWLFTRRSRRQILRAARWIGDAGWILAHRHRRIAAANLRVIYGDRLSERRRRALIRAHFRHAARVLLDVFWFAHDGQARTADWMTTEPSMLAWLDAHPSAVIVTGHIGNWEAAGQMAVARGYPLTSVAKRIGTPDTTTTLNRYRRSLGQKIVMSEGAVRGLVRALQAKEYVALLLDQHVEPQQGGVWVNLFGLQAAVSSAAARLARKFAVPVAVCFAQALPDGRYRCRLLGVCEADADDPVPMTQQIMDLLARAIRRYPSQWLLSYKRWKRWPPGAAAGQYPFYARPWRP